jgi:hypothetical protein
MILHAIAQRILRNEAWFEAVYVFTLRAWDQSESELPKQLAAAKRALADVDQKIARLVDRVEGGFDDPDLKNRLERRRDERRAIARQVEQLARNVNDRGPAPTREWIREQLYELEERLRGHAPAAAYALRELVPEKITVSEIREAGRSRFHLRGRFTLTVGRLSATMTGLTSTNDGIPADPHSEINEEIVIDFLKPNPLDEKAEHVNSLSDQRMPNSEIARVLNCSSSNVTKLRRHWYSLHGQEMPDGRSRRGSKSSNAKLPDAEQGDESQGTWPPNDSEASSPLS